MPTAHRPQNRLILFLVDFAAICCAWIVYYYLRVESGLFTTITIPEFAIPMLVVAGYWIVLYWIFGLYRPWYAQSRFDEFTLILKTVTFGVLVLFFLIFIDDTITQDPAASRLKILLYWAVLVGFTGAGRLALRSVRRRMLIAGIGLHTTVIIGPDERSRDLFRTLRQFPALGHRFIGFLSTDTHDATAAHDANSAPAATTAHDANCAPAATTAHTAPDEASDLPRLGTLDDLERVIESREVEDIIITLDSTEHERLLDVIGRASAFKLRIKIRPDLYDIVSGQARTNQLYGVPLIEVTPQLMAPWEEVAKRTFDIVVSALALVVGAPLFLIIAVAQKIGSPGPIFYRQERVGKDGRVFQIVKFRTMYVDAESRTGPTWAVQDDPRVTPLGRFLRKSHLDELPQFFNVLEGDMSIVGPRPERPFFVEQFIREIPLYRRRLNVRPGITGWAQVRHTYDQTIDDVRTKLSYDLFYIENMSLRMDMKIMISTLYTVFAGKGHA